ncbi:MAG: hypothetical protein ACI9MC_001192 [Kiritimatiellia bacterium]|jgi:hypothetical protein
MPLQRLLIIAPVLLAGLQGCTWDEGLIIENMTGTILVPRAAATQVMNSGEEVTDVRLIGPVFLGLYPDVRDDILAYPHPAVGPSFVEGSTGNTYPYGGTGVGDYRFACLQFLTCKVVSGRHMDFDSMVDWFRDDLQTPIVDHRGREIVSGDAIRQACYDVLNITSDAEIRLTVTDDKNEDGAIDAKDLDFVENSDGDFEADFIIYQQEFFAGMKLWGWMDKPSPITGSFDTCNPGGGFGNREYDQNWTGGYPPPFLLNYPSEYVNEGDWVSGDAWAYETVDDTVVLTIGHEVVR